MFYADFVLSKKGPLSKVWLAAHWEKKLSKAQIYETNVDEAVTEIMRPSQKLALRTTGHLLLGIVRVYSRKTKYLLADCNEAFLKIKLAFRSINNPNPVLPTFTIQDIYGEFGDNILPEFDDEDLNHAPICQSRLDDITLKEDVPQKFEYAIGGDDDTVG
uniref:Rad21_Rec8_N domain-containing protein n=1 Tax=Caenorhabditis japonica TaxID=281687 RepID=A0A8R1IDT2_CAEJA